MATAQKTAARKSAGNPIVNKMVADKLNAGKEPQAPARNEKKDDTRLLSISLGACVSAMTKAVGFSKQSLHLEVAIALAIFATDEKGVTSETKKLVMQVYKDAGFNTAGEDYKTCNRRMNVSAKFYAKLGGPAVQEAMDGAKEGKAIEALTKFLVTEYNFKGINDIIAATEGKKPKQTNTPKARALRAAQANAIATAVPAADAMTADGQKLTAAGEPDKRSAPEGDVAEGQKTRAEHGLQGTSKAEAGVEPQPTPADNAVMAAMEEAAVGQKQADTSAPKSTFGKRSSDSGIIFMAGKATLTIPYGTSGADIQELYTKLAVLMGHVRDDTVVDERFDRYSDSPRNHATHQVAH